MRAAAAPSSEWSCKSGQTVTGSDCTEDAFRDPDATRRVLSAHRYAYDTCAHGHVMRLVMGSLLLLGSAAGGFLDSCAPSAFFLAACSCCRLDGAATSLRSVGAGPPPLSAASASARRASSPGPFSPRRPPRDPPRSATRGLSVTTRASTDGTGSSPPPPPLPALPLPPRRPRRRDPSFAGGGSAAASAGGAGSCAAALPAAASRSASPRAPRGN